MTDETKIDFRFACDEQLELGGAAARFKHNVAAAHEYEHVGAYALAFFLSTFGREEILFEIF